MDDELAPVRGNYREAGYRRVSHGLFLPVVPNLSTSEEWLRELAAWQLVLPDGAVYTHLTAAALSGWWLPRLPKGVPVFAAIHDQHRGPRRPGLVVSRLSRQRAERVVRGMPVDSAEEVLLRCARDFGVLDLVPLVDSALRSGDADRGALIRLCGSGRPGVRALGAAVELADSRSESAWESILRVFHESVDIVVEPQAELFDEDGTFICRGDLLVTGTNFVHEYDGEDHRRPRRQTADLRRDRRLAEAGCVRRGYTADDLLNHPLVTLAELDRALGRRHRPSRLTRWKALLEGSTYSLTGRRRLMNRWLRAMGLTEWSRTA